MFDDDLPWIRVDGCSYGAAKGWQAIEAPVLERLRMLETYTLEYPWSTTSGTYEREYVLLTDHYQTFDIIPTLAGDRYRYEIEPEPMLAILKDAWMSGELPEPDASSDEGTLYDFVSSVLYTLHIELI